jgi:hypothetical protein
VAHDVEFADLGERQLSAQQFFAEVVGLGHIERRQLMAGRTLARQFGQQRLGLQASCELGSRG